MEGYKSAKMKIDVFLRNVLWVIVAVYGVAIAMGVYHSFCNVDAHHVRELAEDLSNASPILFIGHDGLQYGDTEITEEELIDIIKVKMDTWRPYVEYLAEPLVDPDRIAAVVQLIQDHGSYAWNLAENHQQKFIMEQWK